MVTGVDAIEILMEPESEVRFRSVISSLSSVQLRLWSRTFKHYSCLVFFWWTCLGREVGSVGSLPRDRRPGWE